MRFFVAGLLNIETTLSVDAFPIAYNPVNYRFFGIDSAVAGVGLNVSKVLHTLGNTVTPVFLLGDDAAGRLAQAELAQLGFDSAIISTQLRATAQSVIVFDATGRRQIYTDLKDVQEQVFSAETITPALAACDIAVLCNVNYTRPWLQLARDLGKPIASDVHAIHELDDAYNRDYMAAADILFMSHEQLPIAPRAWLRQVQSHYDPLITVIGLGGDGALLGVRGRAPVHVPAVSTRPVVNTIGAGDALFASFLHGYAHTGDPLQALRSAVLFASWKIGANGAAEGFLDSAELAALTTSHAASSR